MRAPLEWIRQYVELPPSVTVDEIVEAFVRVGLEVEDVHRVPETVGALVVGRVLQIEELTDFKKPIRFCQVDVGPGNGPDGGDGPRGIICGARNFFEGDTVVVALPGTVLPGGFAIASRSTYGHISDGMICSAREMGIGADHDGIVVLDSHAQVGADARDLIGAHDAVIEFAITPDRGYTLSVRGLARELASAFDAPFVDPANRPVRPADLGTAVTIDDTERCSRFVAVDVHGVDPAARSPWQMRRRLMAADIRAISLAVDVTNYVMVELGQPLHAFDAAALDGGIVVRRAADGEVLRTLDGQDRTLTADDVVVADASHAVSMAGVMGGESSEISDSTTEVVIEAATWNPPSVSRTVRRHRLPSEAARRFERVVDPALAAVAAERAAELLVASGGGTLGGRTDVGSVRESAAIAFSAADVGRLTGHAVTEQVAMKRLEQVGCRVTAAGAAGDGSASDAAPTLSVVPPTWRPDLVRPADLVEEVARLEGYDAIEPVLPVAVGAPGLTTAQYRRRRVANDLAAAGLTEVLSFPFVGHKDLDALGFDATDPRRRAARLANPLDGDRPLMSTTLLPSLIATVLRNVSRGARDLALFEIGQVVLPGSSMPRPPAVPVDRRPNAEELSMLLAAVPLQPVHVAAVVAGQWERAGWWGPGRSAEPADIWGLARRIGQVCGSRVDLVADDLAPWHPGRCAAIRVGTVTVGHAGELHPAVVERLGLPPRALALELDLSAFSAPRPPTPPVVSAFPPVHLDVALIVDEAMPAADVTDALRDGGGDLLESVRLFDVYTGDQIGSGRKSLAFAMVVRATDRTLTAADATAVRDAAVASAAARVGAEWRG